MEEGQKAENVEKMSEARERGKMGCGQQNKKETQQKEGRKHKESEMNGEGCEEGEREPGRGHHRMSSLCEDTG